MLIGLHGKARSGKTTVANYLRDEHGFIELSFAAPIKTILIDLFNMSMEQVDGDLKEVVDERYGWSPRKLLQYIGTDVFRKLYPNIWADCAIRQYVLASEPNVVISDVRFLNEKDIIEEKGGIVLKIVRDDNPGASSGIAGHLSEHNLDGVADEDYFAVLSAPSGDLKSLCCRAYEALLLARIKNNGQA